METESSSRTRRAAERRIGRQPSFGRRPVFFCIIILISLYAVVRKKSVRGGRLRYSPAAIAATYPLAILSNMSSEAKVIGSRTNTFIFFGVAVVVGGWLAGRLLMQRRVIERMATIGVAVICFLGSTLYGGGPLPILVNGPYIVGAHERSVGSPSLALANWVSTHLPAGSHVAVDRDNAGLLNGFGQVDSANPIKGSDNPAGLFFHQQLTPSDISLVRKDDIRYVVTDTRLTEGLPLFGAYIAPGETGQPTRLTAAELEKFNSTRGVYRIYDNGGSKFTIFPCSWVSALSWRRDTMSAASGQQELTWWCWSLPSWLPPCGC